MVMGLPSTSRIPARARLRERPHTTGGLACYSFVSGRPQLGGDQHGSIDRADEVTLSRKGAKSRTRFGLRSMAPRFACIAMNSADPIVMGLLLGLLLALWLLGDMSAIMHYFRD